MLHETCVRRSCARACPSAWERTPRSPVEGDLAGEIKVARKTGRLTAAEIYPMVTTQAARVLHLNRGEGEIRERGIADLLVVPDSGQNPAEALQEIVPALVILGGRIQLVSTALALRIDPMLTRNMQRIELEGRGAWFVNADVSVLRTLTEIVLGPRFQLAGRAVRA